MIPSNSSRVSPVVHHESAPPNPLSAGGKVAGKVQSGIFNKLAGFNLKMLAAGMQVFARKSQHHGHSHGASAGGPDAGGHIDKSQFMQDIFSHARALLTNHEHGIYEALKNMEKTLGISGNWSASQSKDAEGARRSLAEAGRKNALALIGCNPSEDAAETQDNADASSNVEEGRTPAALPSEIEQEQELLKKTGRENADNPDRSPERTSSQPSSRRHDGAPQ